MKTINDCWQALEDCSSLREVKVAINGFSDEFGDWSYEFEGGAIVIYNRNFDGEVSKALDLTAPDLVLEREDVTAIDPSYETIEVDKYLFDDFSPDAYINVLFVDDEDSTVESYQMTYETDDVIGMEYIGEAGILE